MKTYKVFMTIRGSMVKPVYSGFVKVTAESYDEAIKSAIQKARKEAHWDSGVNDFKVDKVEVSVTEL